MENLKRNAILNTVMSKFSSAFYEINLDMGDISIRYIDNINRRSVGYEHRHLTSVFGNVV